MEWYMRQRVLFVVPADVVAPVTGVVDSGTARSSAEDALELVVSMMSPEERARWASLQASLNL